MIEQLRKALKAEPTKNSDGTYWPSELADNIAIPEKTDYDGTRYPNAYQGTDKKVLLLCTDEDELTCANGEVFRTGNHPTEVFVVVLHLEAAGFGVDFATPTGKSVKIENFAIPQDDDITKDALKRHEKGLKSPLKMSDVLANLGEDSPYIAVYIPGGHGATLAVPFSKDAKGILQWFIDKDRHIITICHGPAGLLSLTIDEDADSFPLKGYKMSAFPDSGDKIMTTMGYLPGEMPWWFGKKLEALGVEIVNRLPTGSTHVDRKLLSGDSPFAGNSLGKLAANTLLDAVHAQVEAATASKGS